MFAWAQAQVAATPAGASRVARGVRATCINGVGCSSFRRMAVASGARPGGALHPESAISAAKSEHDGEHRACRSVYPNP